MRDTETMGCSRQKKVTFQWQGLTLAMCLLARTHFLGGRASSGHNFFFFFFKDYHSYLKNVTRVAPE